MRVLVCGGRDYNDRDHIHNTLCELHATRGPFSCIIHGAATGADTEGMFWAQMMDGVGGRPVKHRPFPADWDDTSAPGAAIRYHRNGDAYNLNAGRARNQRMLDEGKPSLVIAFPGGSGTADMVRRAEKAGVEVIRIAPLTKDPAHD